MTCLCPSQLQKKHPSFQGSRQNRLKPLESAHCVPVGCVGCHLHSGIESGADVLDGDRTETASFLAEGRKKPLEKNLINWAAGG